MNAVAEVDLYTRLWDAVHPEVRPAFDRMAAHIKKQGRGVSIGHDESKDEFTITLSVSETPRSQVLRQVEFRLMSASLHESDEGANVKLSSHICLDGDWVEHRSYCPYNYTSEVWTCDAQELLSRFREADLGQLMLDMLE